MGVEKSLIVKYLWGDWSSGGLCGATGCNVVALETLQIAQKQCSACHLRRKTSQAFAYVRTCLFLLPSLCGFSAYEADTQWCTEYSAIDMLDVATLPLTAQRADVQSSQHDCCHDPQNYDGCCEPEFCRPLAVWHLNRGKILIEEIL